MQLKCAFFVSALVAFFGDVFAAKSGHLQKRSALSLDSWQEHVAEQVLVSHPQQALLTLIRQATDIHAPDPSIASLAAIAASLSQDPSSSSNSVAQIRALVEGLEGALYDECATTQSGINNLSAFDECTTTMEHAVFKCNSSHPNNSAYDNCMSEWKQLNESYETCRSTEEEFGRLKTIVCNDYDNISWDSPFNWHYCPENDPFVGTYEQYLQRNVDKLYTLRALKENCSKATDRWTNKTDLCDAEQIVLDEKWQNCSQVVEGAGKCTDYNCRKHSCSEFDQCWAGALGAFNGEIKLAHGLEQSLSAQWRALQRIECLLDVLDATEGENQTHMLEVCIARHHTVPANLTITNTTPPEKSHCSPEPRPEECPV